MITTGEHTNEAKVGRTIGRLERLVWQSDADDFLREHAERGWTWCAAQLGIPATQVRSRVVRIGIQRRINHVEDAVLLRCHGEGMTNAEMAALFGVHPETIRVHLRRLELPTNPIDEARRIAVRRKNLEATHGVSNTAQLAAMNRRTFCRETLGWEMKEPSASVTCEALRRLNRPANRHEIAEEYRQLRGEHPNMLWMPTNWRAALKWCKWLQDRNLVNVTGRGPRLRHYQLSETAKDTRNDKEERSA